jgi:hypothetical protein
MYYGHGEYDFLYLHAKSTHFNQIKTKVTTPSKSQLLKLNKEFREKVLTIHGLLTVVRV